HCLTSRYHVEAKFNLGPWVSTQRTRKDVLPLDRKLRLDAIGFVWDWIDYRWEQGFTALLKFMRREGHCRVPIFHREGEQTLGWWVCTQRRNKKELSAERKSRLNKIGFVWKENMGAGAYSRTPRKKRRGKGHVRWLSRSSLRYWRTKPAAL